MKEKEIVSIVVCCYNQEKYIRECLNSIKAQTYSSIQLILADDASQDKSVEVFEAWLEENNYIATTNFHQKNTGLSAMLNECIELVEGKYVKIIAADDFLHPEAIEKCITKLENLGNAYGMIFTDTYAIDDNSSIISDIADYNTTGTLEPIVFRDELLKGNRIPALTVVMRTDVLKETGKYDSKFLVEDYYRWLKINEKYFISYIPEKLAYYRIHTQNISAVKAERINLEFAMLQTMFDKKGIARHKINGFVQDKYLANQKIPQEFFALYKNYPFNIKRLVFCVQYHVPPSMYKIACKYF
ncbi:glycosyltransferase family 2 protein [Chryseobacterium oryctis]|uniref:Glycosyltransferase family 2 protein n=1 Tax=Chryseobacterium oryctis TaxID=2952618 RepID=A0ABT3HL40_9FLAO|nr:glycosyltransferase family 2 protein [Chryseobacterium oryctis]MCW3160390.1 glycosyltransferase family 2 protein [Chryseobacterium oryctis]